jgi:phosphatidylinositol alpha-1,6-mannosyltransferase
MSTSKRRILLVTTDFPPFIGGIQQWTSQVASHLAERHDITVIAPAQKGDGAFDAGQPYRVVRFPNRGPRPVSLAALALAVLRELARAKPDVVFFCHIFAAVTARGICRRFGVPYMVATYGMELQARRVQPYLRDTFAGSAGAITISRHTASLMQEKGAAPKRINLVGVGVPRELLSAPPASLDDFPELPRPSGRVILTVARLDERYKGHDTMLGALPLIAARVPDVTYVVTGDGRYRQYYEDLATALGVRDRVVFTGKVGDAERLALYDRCDLFALISRVAADGGVEGFGIVFLEAAARCKPAVGGRSGGVLDAIVDGETGLLVDPTDIGAVADACVRLLEDRGLAASLGAAGRERVRTTYTWEHVAVQVEKVLLGVPS